MTELPDKRKSSYVEQFGIRIEPELKRDIETLKASKKTEGKDVYEAIRVFMRKLVSDHKSAS